MMNIKVDKDLKIKAQKVAKDLGLPMSIVINNYLREFVDEKRVVFDELLVPNKRTARILRQADKDYKEGKNLSPTFSNMQEAIDYLMKL